MFAPRYNIAPGQRVPCVKAMGLREREKVLSLALFFPRWGLVPSWATDPKIGNRLINARAETLLQKPSFRSAFCHRRCLVLADGFYEWGGDAGTKKPYYFRLADRAPFAFAGLFECWEDPRGGGLETFTVITTEANSLVGRVHDRMPVIMGPSEYEPWLDTDSQDPASLLPLLRPYPSEAMIGYPVSFLVNNPENDHITCIEPMR